MKHFFLNFIPSLFGGENLRADGGAIQRLVDEARERRHVPLHDIFSTSQCKARLGIMEQRSALPVRSPMPLTVPCTRPTPALTDVRVFATANPCRARRPRRGVWRVFGVWWGQGVQTKRCDRQKRVTKLYYSHTYSPTPLPTNPSTH